MIICSQIVLFIALNQKLIMEFLMLTDLIIIIMMLKIQYHEPLFQQIRHTLSLQNPYKYPLSRHSLCVHFYHGENVLSPLLISALYYT